MAPIEVLFGALVLMFALIGLVRGFLRELGVTTVLVIVLLALHLLEPLLEQGLGRILASGDALQTARVQAGQTWFFVLVIVSAAFISYAGETLSFRGERLGGALGMGLGLITGAVNGYLAVGSIWYYLDRWDYAIGFLGLRADALSEKAQSLIAYLPLNLLGQTLFLGESWLLYLALFLLIARVIR